MTSIGNCAFSFCSSLKEIVIPKGVTSIDDSAFCECGSLQGIIIPESITSIGEAAFKGCHSLTQVFIPKKLYDEIELKKVFDDSAEDIICLYSCINDGNGAVSLKSIDSDFAEVVFNVAPNENFEVDKIYRIDSSGTSEPRELIYRNGECRLYRRGLDMKDLTIYATFTRVRANITFCSEDGTNILQSGTYKINEIPSYTEDIPVKDSDGDTTYVFAGWSDGTVTYGLDVFVGPGDPFLTNFIMEMRKIALIIEYVRHIAGPNRFASTGEKNYDTIKKSIGKYLRKFS